MDTLYELLSERLKGVKKLAVLGAGSVLKADDAAGMRVIEKLQAELRPFSNIGLYPGETAPENYSGKIIEFYPTHLLVVDAADLGLSPGSIADIDPNDVGGPMFCSHMLPLKVMVDYIKSETGAKVTLLGIQHKNLGIDCEMTNEVEQAVDEVCTTIKKVVYELLYPITG